jgi:hypothetical protein
VDVIGCGGWCLGVIAQVAGETETKGQIKLRFKTAAGKDVVCIRSFQLTQKASKMEYKAIESVLQTINSITGEVWSFFTQNTQHEFKFYIYKKKNLTSFDVFNQFLCFEEEKNHMQ